MFEATQTGCKAARQAQT